MTERFTADDDALLNELGLGQEEQEETRHTPREEQIIAGFEDIQRFVDEHGRAPRHGETQDIFERIHAVRLERMREQAECHTLLAPLDHRRLLTGETQTASAAHRGADDDALLAALGAGEDSAPLTELRHVRPTAEKRAAAEEVANREPCRDFEAFRPLFERVQNDLDRGLRETRPFRDGTRIERGNWFILSGQKALVASVGTEFVADYGRKDCRLRVIFDNGTEIGMLRRSLERALHKDRAGRRITDPMAGPLFAHEADEADLASGTIYVLRSKSAHPTVAGHREILHKIGVTGDNIRKRIAHAALDPTFLMADVEIAATYTLYGINRNRLEKLIHRLFAPARLDITITDRFGNPVTPREWFLVPLSVIDEAVERIRDETITDFVYDPEQAMLKRPERR